MKISRIISEKHSLCCSFLFILFIWSTVSDSTLKGETDVKLFISVMQNFFGNEKKKQCINRKDINNEIGIRTFLC